LPPLRRTPTDGRGCTGEGETPCERVKEEAPRAS
jgi:hypothetical protein